MKVKVFLMLDIDEEENILPIDDDIEDAVPVSYTHLRAHETLR